VEFKWNRGVIFTNKAEGLWDPIGKVTREDIDHMKSRVEMFTFSHQFVREGGAAMGDGVPECRRCFAKWIVDACADFDAAVGLRVAPALEQEGGTVDGLADLLVGAKIPQRLHADIQHSLLEFGAVSVNEVTQDDWEQLDVWQSLKVAERRRIVHFQQRGAA